MSDDQKPNNLIERRVSLALGVGLTIWDVYAQANAIPYTMPAWVYGIVLYPYGESAYGASKDAMKRLPDLLAATIKRLPKKN